MGFVVLGLGAFACEGAIEARGSGTDGGGPTDAADGGDRSSADAAAPDAGLRCDEGADSGWRCEGDDRVRCVGGTLEVEACDRGCLPPDPPEGNAECIVADPSWSCASSEYEGEQWWTCDLSSGELHICDDEGPVVVRCSEGCWRGDLGTHDGCLPDAGESPIEAPAIHFSIGGGLFSEAAVRGPVEEGVRYMLDRMAEHVAISPDATIPDITVNYSPAPDGQSFCTGIAFADSTNISCPYDYPISGDNQNYVVNITMHEIGHILALHLIASADARDLCENEGLATWIAGRYWMNVASSPVSSLREAARGEIDLGRATASMTDCVSASDAPYKVYGSFFEYLEGIPGAIRDVSTDSVEESAYIDDWRAWLGR